MIYTKRSARTPEDIDGRLRQAAQNHKFRVLNVQDLRGTLKGKGIELGADCRVYDVCNPQAALQALQTNMGISTVLPCRISVYTDEQGTAIATLMPSAMLGATGLAGVEQLAKDVEREIVAIIDEAA